MWCSAETILDIRSASTAALVKPGWDCAEMCVRVRCTSQCWFRSRRLLAWESPSAGWLSGLSHTIVICREMCAFLPPHAIPQSPWEEHACHGTVCWPHYVPVSMAMQAVFKSTTVDWKDPGHPSVSGGLSPSLPPSSSPFSLPLSPAVSPSLKGRLSSLLTS